MKTSLTKFSNPYDIVYVDPPWDYKGQLQHSKPGLGDTGGAVKHYSTVTLPRLKEFPMQDILNKDALVFMWVTNPHLDQGIDLLRAWGLKYATVGFVWNKMRVNPGFYTMSQCELCLVAKNKGGKIPRPRGARNIRQYIESMREKHSKKPDDARVRIDKMFPEQSKLELFARSAAPGWDVWGDEVSSDPVLKEYLNEYGW